ncbi:class I SAM-dependent methyltransferase [uncultured Pseudodesulfovibrio sp.]|uniref:class I SAM-dependent methyltransferase n=1 Tax=uncultured Pseudodesulfovibrio sp. TaxID=2035858 RepID=UPI0029C6A396|nr:class I SAM-dependent methyltransferase [uncultured Pseudodesulfovibrio sp.]
MINVQNNRKFDFETVSVDEFWNTGEEKELKMHRIHAYPAKFPAFITTKALNYAYAQSLHVDSMADIFCGCGTTAFEAKRNKINFWGCDINPVATLIAKAKSKKYQPRRLLNYLNRISARFAYGPVENVYSAAPERLKYWYKEKQYNDLFLLKKVILHFTPPSSDYRLFFLCAFSNILKSTSVWLTKSIKPQVDPNKKPRDVMAAFREQCRSMMVANAEIDSLSDSESEIVTGSFLGTALSPPAVDLIVTSPPYVTSYEYADLHQLSTLWLDFALDYRELREGSIGSRHHAYNFNREWKRLNHTGARIVSRLLDQHKSKARSVTKYFLDMQQVAHRVHGMLNDRGIVLFVIGNTEYKGVRIDNAKHLSESLFSAGFNCVQATKRKISKKILTPYRDERGKFSSDSSGRKVYSEEFILIGRK